MGKAAASIVPDATERRELESLRVRTRPGRHGAADKDRAGRRRGAGEQGDLRRGRGGRQHGLEMAAALPRTAGWTATSWINHVERFFALLERFPFI